MQDRETALKEQENAREWQAIAYGDHPATWAALAYYRERGWPVDANTFPERDRCENRIFAFKAGYAAALASPLSAPPQVDVVALARAYRALVEHVAEQQATPDESWRAQADSLDRMLELEAALTKAALDKAKRRALTIFDTWLRVTGAMPAGSSWVCEAESCIEDAVEIGVQAAYGIHRPLESESDAAPPQEPTGASPQAETSEASVVAAIARHRMNHSDAWSTGFVAALGCCADDLPDEIVAIRPNRADLPDAKAYRRVYRRGFIEALARAAALVEAAVERTIAEFKQHPAPVSPVEPEPPTNPACARCGHALSAHRPDFGACDGRERPCACPEYQAPPVEPTPEPETCEWRYNADAEWWQSGCDSQDLSGDERLVGPDEKAKFCPYCGKPLRLVPSEEPK